MSFNETEHQALASLFGEHQEFFERLKNMGIETVEQLIQTSISQLLHGEADIKQCRCWKDNLQERKIWEDVLLWAQEHIKNNSI